MSGSGGTSEGEPTPLGTPAGFDGGLVEIADRAWAWIQPNGGLGESNAGLIAGAGESLLIDTLWDERLTANMLASIGPVTEREGAPIRRLFNTHGDGDHWYGNGLLDDEVEIVATELAALQMGTEPPAMLTRLAPAGTVAGLAGRVPMLPGAARMRGLAAFGAMLANYEFAGIDPRIPDRTFTDSEELGVGGRPVELIEVGPAHTTGDAIAWLADARVAFVGDILFNGTVPIMWAGPVENWIAALDRIEELDPAVVVGGHGPVAGLEEIRLMREHWRWLAEQVAEAGGKDAGKLAERLVRSREWRDSPWGEWDTPERTFVNVSRIAATSAGGGSEVGTVERLRLLAGMGALGERLGG